MMIFHLPFLFLLQGDIHPAKTIFEIPLDQVEVKRLFVHLPVLFFFVYPP